MIIASFDAEAHKIPSNFKVKVIVILFIVVYLFKSSIFYKCNVLVYISYILLVCCW
jgi:hypothetical protein